jgi:serine/threonine-protein kinase RsbW
VDVAAVNGAATTWPARRPPLVEPTVGHWVVRTSSELTAARRELVAIAAGIPAPPPAETGRPVIALPDRLALLLSELVTNVLRHAEPPAEVRVRQGEGRCLIDVADPVVDVPPAPDDERSPGLGGHGLPLVAELAVDRGWYVEGDHKHVWALLRTGV